MIRTVLRAVGALLRIALFAVLVLALVWSLVAFGLIDTGGQGSSQDSVSLPEWVPGPDLLPGGEPESTPHPGDPGSTAATTNDSVTSGAVEERIHERINEIRVDNDLGSVDHDERIANVSRAHSRDMADREYFSHVSPDGETPADRMDEFRPRPCRAVGENLALVWVDGGDSADDVAQRAVDGWMDSEGHRENILTAEWDSQGIGVYIADDGQVYATETFCSRW